MIFYICIDFSEKSIYNLNRVISERKFYMTFEEAMRERHTVRKFTDKEIPKDIKSKLNTRVFANNEKYSVSIRFMIDDTNAFGFLTKAFLTKGVKNYFILSGGNIFTTDEKLGYCGTDLMLYAQTLGLNTWWVGGTYNRRYINRNATGDKVLGLIAVGYGETQGVPHKSRPLDEVCKYEGDMPEWFKNGVEAALLAPTALNKQAFFIEGKENNVALSCDNGIFSGVDKGIVKYHFELGAGTENFFWVNDL